jgi:hypothetical protein
MRSYLKFFSLFAILSQHSVFADTIDHFMNIVTNIPQMEIKADQQSQIWAHSARTVITLTCDGITDALMLANNTATQQKHPLFCLPPSTQITPEMLSGLIQLTYKDLQLPQVEKDKMTVSQVALLGLQKQYPCDGKNVN